MTQPTLSLRIGGVPEHFNYPWHLVQRNGLDEHRQLDFTWHDYPGGTGAMLEDLRDEKLDVAIMLTEGAIAGIAKGDALRIVGTYVASSLQWGIHVHAESRWQKSDRLAHARYAISRPRSGSHLMASVHAWQQGWDPHALPFVEVGSLEGAREALAAGQADVFLWEKFTTKPLVDRGEWRRIGEVPTPWPSFVMVARHDIINEHATALEGLMHMARQGRHQMNEADTIAYIAATYGQQTQDVKAWYQQTRWLIRPRVSRAGMEEARDALHSLKVIPEKTSLDQLLWSQCRATDQRLSETMYDWRVESVHKLLARQGKSCGPLMLKDLLALGHLDQYHYLGKKTSYELIDLLDLQPKDHVFDIGSGVGGTSRVLASEAGCKVTALEVQPELNELAEELTYRLGLSDHITYLTADFPEVPAHEKFDHFLSLLVFLHIPQRPEALAAGYRSLKPGGRFVIEDLILRHEMPQEEQQALRETLSAPTVTFPKTYCKELENAGFEAVEVTDLSDSWREWTQYRYQDFVDNEADNRALFGDDVFAQRRHFYQTVRDLFAGGNLGGIRIMGRKPLAENAH